MTIPCGIGTEEMQSVLLGLSLGYPGFLSVFSITGPHPACIKAKEQKTQLASMEYFPQHLP